MADICFPVCSPKLMEGPHALNEPRDLRHHTLLSDDASRVPGIPDWNEWLAAAGIKGIDTGHGLTYNDSAMLVQAAVEGHGVAMARLSLAEGDLAAGRLVKPFALELRSQFAYYLTIPAGTLDQPKVKAFRHWILEEARKSPLGAEARPQGA
jgi:LysR family glycine cleavage system transcriptional activator